MSSEQHPGDLLSALLDGELSVAEADQVEAHVRGCGSCGAELDEVREARAVLRALPALDPPSWLVTVGDASPQRVPRALQVLVSVAAGAGALLLAAGSLAPSAASPAPGDAVASHAATVAALGATRGGGDALLAEDDVTPTTARKQDVGSLSAPLRTPPLTIGAYRFVDAYESSDDGVHVLYRSARFGLSVFETPGEIDWDALPAGQGRRMEIAGHAAWRWESPPADGRVVVYEVDGVVVTVVADEAGDAVVGVAEALPGPRGVPMAERIERALTRALKGLAPG